jgi:hypothetical protein
MASRSNRCFAITSGIDPFDDRPETLTVITDYMKE